CARPLPRAAGRRPGSAAERLQARLLDAGELAAQPLVLALLLGRPLHAFVGEVALLQRVRLQVVHLPLRRHVAVHVVVARELPALLADADDVVRRFRVRAAGLAGLEVVVREDGVLLRRALRRAAEDLLRVVDALPVRARAVGGADA